jgi:UPF0755 protein
VGRRIIRFLFVLVLLVIVAGAAGAWFVFERVSAPYRGYGGVEQFVDLVPGDGTQVIGRKLVDAGVVRDRWVFRLALWRSNAARRLMAGEYRFDRPMTPLEVVEKLARGDVYLRAITFPEGLNITEMSRLFESHGFGPASDFVKAARRAELIHDLDPAARDLEGYLFPETYTLSRRAGAPELVRLMVARFHQVFSPDLGQAAASHGLSVRQAVTLASVVEKETARLEERPTVAGVYLERLRIGMALQCDPTVIFALQIAGRYRGNLTKDNLAFDSPYNTYRYRGLPPGPIAAPSRTSLEAAASPAATSYLYFVSRNDGSHEFARTLDEHNRNVFKYQVQYFRQKRQGQR